VAEIVRALVSEAEIALAGAPNYIT
jgi:hypothetical protein